MIVPVLVSYMALFNIGKCIQNNVNPDGRAECREQSGDMVVRYQAHFDDAQLALVVTPLLNQQYRQQPQMACIKPAKQIKCKLCASLM
jgi:hypothetical protein